MKNSEAQQVHRNLIATIHAASKALDETQSNFEKQQERFELHNKACSLCMELIELGGPSSEAGAALKEVLRHLIASELDMEVTGYKEMIAILKEREKEILAIDSR